MMADFTLDEYIQKSKIGVSGMNKIDGRSALLSRLGVPTQPHKQAVKRSSGQNVGLFDARNKIIRSSDAPVVIVKPQLDARSFLENKRTSIQDARVHLSQKKNFQQTNQILKQGPTFKLDVINDYIPQPSASFGNFVAPIKPNALVKDFGGQLRKTVINNPATATFPLKSAQSSFQEQIPSTPKDITNPDIQRMYIQGQPQSFISPIQSFRILVTNLGPNVSFEDVEELFGSCGALRKVKMLKSGIAEVFYVTKESAFAAVEEYHNRELDDKPMSVKLSFLQSTTPENKPLRSKKKMASSKKVLDLEECIVRQALFSGLSYEQAPNVDFTVHL